MQCKKAPSRSAIKFQSLFSFALTLQQKKEEEANLYKEPKEPKSFHGKVNSDITVLVRYNFQNLWITNDMQRSEKSV